MDRHPEYTHSHLPASSEEAENINAAGNRLWLGIAIGALAGLGGTIVMTQFQNAMSSLAKPKENNGNGENSGENATVRTADAVTKLVTGREVADDHKVFAGQMVHYSFGTAMGAVYGAMSEIRPASSAGMGLPFGTALWLAADEAALPALGLSGPPRSFPVRTHVYGFASHLVYGASTELFRKGLRRLLMGRE